MKTAWLVTVLCATSLLTACGGDKPSDAPQSDPKVEMVKTTEAPAAPVEQTAVEPLPAALAGTWQSEDQSFVVKIQGSDWLESSEGTPMPAQTVEYQSNCAYGEKNQPCLLVKWEFDAIFYAIVQLDANNLVLKMIDGDMPQQVFKRVP